MKKVSIIIPNYNNGKFIEQCLESVVNQNYPSKEIIIIDDGSNDDSVEKIKSFIKKYGNEAIKLICQTNLNASIARNEGIKMASGDYVLFLDSDDLLEDSILDFMVKEYEDQKVDLIIGNYEKINENGDIIGERIFSDNNTIVGKEKNFNELINFDPVPSNKFYNLRIIKENNIWWGNVRIGQDLNFYLKYLLLCKKILLTNRHIYKYRINNSSVSRTYDLRIFDIVNVFSDVEKFYTKNNRTILYKKDIPALTLKHYGFQMDKQFFYSNYGIRKLIIEYFSIQEKLLDYSHCKQNDAFKKMRRKFRIKCALRLIIASNIYRWLKLRKTKK